MRTLLGAITVFTLAILSTAFATAQTDPFGFRPSFERVLYAFDTFGRTDGQTPMAPVVVDGTGSLYGTTEYGGLLDCNGETCGTVFKLTKVGSQHVESLIHLFTGGADGEYPVAPLLIGADGTLYGDDA